MSCFQILCFFIFICVNVANVFQTLKFCKDLGRFTGLRAICVLGGDSMEKQFALMHENPVNLFRVIPNLTNLFVTIRNSFALVSC